jgi:type 1 glutamine amidotransferase
MCDSFRDCTDWQFLTGGQWVAHPGDDGVRYAVQISDAKHPITQGISDFEVESEQYYMHVDPAVRVLATTKFPVANGPHVTNGEFHMPVVWTKMYGSGRVFYCSLGHKRSVLEMEPVRELMRRGFGWAAG